MNESRDTVTDLAFHCLQCAALLMSAGTGLAMYCVYACTCIGVDV